MAKSRKRKIILGDDVIIFPLKASFCLFQLLTSEQFRLLSHEEAY